MWMSDAEIKESYERALKPKEQIAILAQLNACPVEYIVESLKRSGVRVGKRAVSKSPTTTRHMRCDKEVAAKWLTFVDCMDALKDNYTFEELHELTGLSMVCLKHYFVDRHRPTKEKFEQLLRGVCLTREQFFKLSEEE